VGVGVAACSGVGVGSAVADAGSSVFWAGGAAVGAAAEPRAVDSAG